MMNPLASNLRNLRLEKQMTQEHAAESLGVSARPCPAGKPEIPTAKDTTTKPTLTLLP